VWNQPITLAEWRLSDWFSLLPSGETISAASTCYTVYRQCLKEKLQQLMLGDDIYYDSATPHTVVWTVWKGSNVTFTTITGHQIFGPLKNSAVQVINCLHANDTDYFTKGSGALVSCWDKCLSDGGNYVEKWCARQCIYEGQSISFRIEFFVLIRSVVTTPATRGIIPKVSWVSVLKASFLCALCVTQL